MKKLLLLQALFCLCFTGAGAQDQTGGLTVHEWGTFTTLQGSDGKRLPGLYLEEEHLPRFVHCHKGFSPDPTVRDKGLYKPAHNVTVKMETPVLYFYAQQETDFSVKVRFPAGSISQWYPQRSAGENDRLDTIDFAKQFNGWIQWDGKVLAPGSQQPLSPDQKELTNTWTAPRATDANLVTASGETEKYLFYRGVGYFDVPLHVSFNSSGQLVLKNLGSDDIPYVFIYDKPKKDGAANVWWTGSIAAGSEKLVEPSHGHLTEEQLRAKMTEFENALTQAGLYQKESAAMLNTWRESYFNHDGLRVFWILPEKLTEEILPLEMSPKPDELRRVLVGRSEVLTPQFEQLLLSYFMEGKMDALWGADRYYLAYKSRIEAISKEATGVEEFSLDSRQIEILPNPVRGKFSVKAELDGANRARLTVSTLRGEKVLSLEADCPAGTLFREIDLEKAAAGSYLLLVETEKGRFVKKIIKE